LGVGLTTLPCKKKIVEKLPRNSFRFCGEGQGLSWAVEPRNEEREVQIKEGEMGGHVARMGEMRNVYKILIGNPGGKILLRRYRRIWEDNIKLVLGKIGWEGVVWLYLAQYRD
jgi:hypothetical protein